MLINFIKAAFDILKKWRRLIIFYGIVGLAILTTIAVLVFTIRGELLKQTIYQLSLIVSLIFLINLGLAKIFPRRFISWKWNNMDETIDFTHRFFLPPFSTLVMSIALGFFILSLFNNEIMLLWNNTLSYFDEGYKQIAILVFAPIGGIVMVGILLFISSFAQLGENKSFFTKSLVVFGFICTWTFLLWFYYSLLLGGLNDAFTNFVVYPYITFIKFVIGAAPIGWFYELFIGSIVKKTIEKNLVR